jgi:hypothetical protein
MLRRLRSRSLIMLTDWRLDARQTQSWGYMGRLTCDMQQQQYSSSRKAPPADTTNSKHITPADMFCADT